MGAKPVILLCALTLGFSLPLLGVWWAGKPIAPYIEWPPMTRYVVHAPFSWTVSLGLLLLMGGALAPLVLRVLRTTPREQPTPVAAFPWWGWGAAIWTLMLWGLAWSRFEWMQPFQAHTFFPLWLGYIVLVNALTFRRVGWCMLVDRPRYVLSLFSLSAAFWWFFEYLNRFVQNWYYLGGDELSAGAYVLQATVAFSTVLPAVLGTAEWLTSYPRCSAGLDQFVRIPFPHGTIWGWVMLGIAAGGLVGIGLWPDYLFPLVWVAPLLLITALQLIHNEPTVFSETAHGDWRRMWIAALSALICGFFWETWNYYSLAHWEYAVPFVQGLTMFHMPLLGYAGYFPFGLECLAVVELCLARKFAGGVAYYRVSSGEVDLAQRKPTVADR
ncbi:MAG: hypothetical protein JSR62_14720 [Nitrospira sp.]|nr:hypothetical protein [Nitrospira sp.]